MEFSRENKGVLKVTRKSKADLGEKKKKMTVFIFFLKTKYVLEQHQSSSLPLIF